MVAFRSSPWLLLPLLLVSRAGESPRSSVESAVRALPGVAGETDDYSILLPLPQLLPRTPYLPLQPRGSLAARAARSWPSCGSARRRHRLTARTATPASQPAPSARPWAEGWSRSRTQALPAPLPPLDPHQHWDREGFGRSVGAPVLRSASGLVSVRRQRWTFCSSALSGEFAAYPIQRRHDPLLSKLIRSGRRSRNSPSGRRSTRLRPRRPPSAINMADRSQHQRRRQSHRCLALSSPSISMWSPPPRLPAQSHNPTHPTHRRYKLSRVTPLDKLLFNAPRTGSNRLLRR